MQVDVFKLEITLGNDAIQDAQEVAQALASLARRIGNTSRLDDLPLFDMNGNCVGRTSMIKRRV